MKWGVIGLGYMAKKFASSIKDLKGTEVKAISSRSILKLNKFGNKFNIREQYRFKSYDDILKCDDIDNIYISTINNTHFEIILKAIEANKNILCEKPISTNYKDTLKIIEALKNKKIFFMEAIPYRAHPLINLIIKTLKEKTIGEIVSIKSNFGIKKKIKSKNHRLFNAKLGGGAMLDLGCYPISFSNLIANLNNEKRNFIAKVTNAHSENIKNGVDTESYVSLLYNNKIVSEIGISIIKNMENKTIINGTKGLLTIDNLWSPEEKSYIEVEADTRYYKLFTKSKFNLLTNQINIVNRFIKYKKFQGEYPCMSWQDSIDIAFILDKWKKFIIKRNEN